MRRKIVTALLLVAMTLPVSPVFADELPDKVIAPGQQVAELQSEVDALKEETGGVEKTENDEQTYSFEKEKKDGSRIGPGIIIENISNVSLEIT